MFPYFPYLNHFLLVQMYVWMVCMFSQIIVYIKIKIFANNSLPEYNKCNAILIQGFHRYVIVINKVKSVTLTDDGNI